MSTIEIRANLLRQQELIYADDMTNTSTLINEQT